MCTLHTGRLGSRLPDLGPSDGVSTGVWRVLRESVTCRKPIRLAVRVEAKSQPYAN